MWSRFLLLSKEKIEGKDGQHYYKGVREHHCQGFTATIDPYNNSLFCSGVQNRGKNDDRQTGLGSDSTKADFGITTW